MSKGKKARAKQKKVHKAVKSMMQKHHTATQFRRKKLASLCNQFAYGHIGPTWIDEDK